MASPPSPKPRRPFIIEIWEENREIFKAVVTDVLLFLSALAALFGVYVLLHAIENAGYPHERIALHYWAYVCVDALFLTDLVVKLFLFLFLRANR